MSNFPNYKTVPVADLVPYARNSRTHSDAQVAKIAASIREFGFLNPVITDGENGIIAGHGRVLAAQKLNLDVLPCIEAKHLTTAQRRAYVIADNRLALDAGWDDELLRVELDELKDAGFDLSLTGFEVDEIEGLSLDPEPVEGLTDEDAVPEAPGNPLTAEGDLWLLGRHRLMCGDSTSIDSAERLMDARRADMVFTDPPYALFGNSTGVAGVADDKMIRPFFRSIGASIYNTCKQGAHFYSCLDWRSWAAVLESYTSSGLTVKNMIVWDKGSGALGAAYRSQHELIMFGSVGNSGISITKAGPSSEHKITDVNVWKCARENKNGMHAALKPQELIGRAIENSSNGNDLILDLFGGSGSTLIACEKTNRDCRMMEIDPKYCDVIIKRWQDFTGQQATLESTGKTFDEIANAS